MKVKYKTDMRTWEEYVRDIEEQAEKLWFARIIAAMDIKKLSTGKLLIIRKAN